MTNNDLLRSLRFALNMRDRTLLTCFEEGGIRLTPDELAMLFAREGEPNFEPLTDALFGAFLEGLIVVGRGRREPKPGEERPSERPELTNNRILRALRIALELKDTDIVAIMEQSNTPISKTEVGALFRREDHRNYQPCGNQFLRNFLRGLATWYQGKGEPSRDP